MARTSQMIPSKYLKQEDVPTPVLLTIKSVQQVTVGKDEEATMRWAISFNETEKPMTLNVSNILTLESYLGDETDNWIGKQTVLYVDPDVMYAGKRVGGLRPRAPKGQEPKKDIDTLPF